jgi:membrane protease YdiL (CAAX protease family)
VPTERIWRFEAIARLLAAMALCVFLGQTVLTVVRFDIAHSKISQSLFYCEAGASMLALSAGLWSLAKPWKLEAFGLQAAIFLLSASLGLTFASFAYSGGGIVGRERTVLGMLASTISFQGASIALIWVFVRQHGLRFIEAFGFRNHPRHAVMLGATIALGFVPLGLGLQFALGTLASAFHLQLPEQDAVFILRLADSWLDRIVLGAVAIIIAPVAEESLFRGIFYPAIKRLGFPNAALWISSLVFGLIHFNVLSFLPLVVLAVVLVKLYEKTGNLLACIGCHAAFNAFNFILMLLVDKFGGTI